MKCSGSDLEQWTSQRSADDAVLDLAAEGTRAELLAAMEWHVLGQAELTGVYTPQP